VFDRVGSPYGGVTAFVDRNFCVRDLAESQRVAVVGGHHCVIVCLPPI